MARSRVNPASLKIASVHPTSYSSGYILSEYGDVSQHASYSFDSSHDEISSVEWLEYGSETIENIPGR